MTTRGAIVGVMAAVVGAWALSKLTPDPISFTFACSLAVFLALGMIVGMFKLGRFSSDRD
jgi:hypothetical protein